VQWSKPLRTALSEGTFNASRARSSLLSNGAIIAPALVTVISLLIYLSALPKSLAAASFGADGGELITASTTLGIAHPPGYPLYIVIGKTFSWLPFGSTAARFNLFSAVATSIGVGVVTYILTTRNGRVSRSTLPATGLGLALALTPIVWGQAIIAEVYGLQLALVALFALAIVRGHSPAKIGLALGLSISGHLAAILLIPLAIWRIEKSASALMRCLAGMLAGLAPFLLLPLLASGNSPIIWGNPTSLRGWWWLVSARLYQPNVFALPPDLWPARFLDWIESGVLLPLMVWLLLAIVSVARAKEKDWKLSAAMTVSALAYTVYAFTYRANDAAVLLLPGIVLATIVAGRWLLEEPRPTLWLIPIVMAGLLILTPGSFSAATIEDEVAARIDQIPRQAIVLTPGDASIAALWYFHHVEGHRPDLVIVDGNMFQFDWYRQRLSRDHPMLFVPSADDLGAFETKNRRVWPVCHLTLFKDQVSCILPNESLAHE